MSQGKPMSEARLCLVKSTVGALLSLFVNVLKVPPAPLFPAPLATV